MIYKECYVHVSKLFFMLYPVHEAQATPKDISQSK